MLPNSFKAGGETDVRPDELIAIARPGHFDGEPDRPQNVHAVLVGGHDGDRCRVIELGYVVDAVGFGTVATHVVNDATGGHHHPISTLFDPLDVGGVCATGMSSTIAALLSD